MKTLTAFFLLSCAIAVCAEDAKESKDPVELAQVRNTFQTQMKAATTPIIQRYLQQLDALKKQLGGKGDVNGAVAVQKEIDAFAVKPEKPVDINIKNLIGKWDVRFTNGHSCNWTFEEGGSLKSNDGNTGTWEIQKDKVLLHWKCGIEESLNLPIKKAGTKGNNNSLGANSLVAKQVESDIGEPKDPRK
jgi:hypothetical protein